MAKYFSYSTNDDDFFIFDTLEQAKQATLEKARDLYENFGYDGFLDDEQIGWIEDCFYGEVLGKIHIPKRQPEDSEEQNFKEAYDLEYLIDKPVLVKEK
ncbi:hypothetical protein [Lonepinella koalarum]|uniref:Uncharacterized protein n=1 Tax=Lonepinella koalarum TaxID=53417 RepID=A0A4R1KXK9_9PAST|nr:hypothetical protein [Lonepinella koalarum]MDH2925580.1 hypothetical protein [Lonepinella koalarum]MDH2927276.1 hypothetical protein [Lonepinella koalarum]MDH2927300.1 hypothetical protein [Lonepinella koalarum]TCK70142.1 hypothetical protein EV692_1369 [Lonepinella koalarum]TFJ90267.1 hypothetical protein E0709_02700 [Lonepinella koalarum]